MPSSLHGRVRRPHRPTAEITVHKLDGNTRSIRLSNILAFASVEVSGGQLASLIRLHVGGNLVCQETFDRLDQLINGGEAVSHE